jgi:hypothetical protein
MRFPRGYGLWHELIRTAPGASGREVAERLAPAVKG